MSDQVTPRDLFAAHAMRELLNLCHRPRLFSRGWFSGQSIPPKMIAEASFELADCMLAAREGEGGGK